MNTREEQEKGIRSKAGKEMANKKFQLDRNKADKDGDGKLSKYEEASGEAIQKAQDAGELPEDETVEMYHGGMPCDCGGDCDGSCGGMMDGIMGYDDVSGNPIPYGSNAENVRDDISAMLSTDEYVLPADVVKWHGLKHIMDMQDEAKMGLMMMNDMGLIQHIDDEETEEVDEDTESEEDEGPEVEETPEGNEVEFPVVETIEEEIIEGEEEIDPEEDYGKEDKPSMFGMVKKPKVTFII
jgi:hypothetical protein